VADSLTLHTLDHIKLDETETSTSSNSIIQEQSALLVDKLFNTDLRDLQKQQEQIVAVRDLGASVQKDLTRRSNLLKEPLTKLVSDAEDGGEVGKALLNLQTQTDIINPNKIDFAMGTIRRWLAKIPGIGTPLAMWFAKYQTVEGVINEIVKNLENGQAQLERDNTTLKADQIEMRTLIFKLQDYVDFGLQLDQQISEKLANDTNIEEAQKRYIEEEILFALKQRNMDLQQQLAVNQQGVLTSEVIIRNNRELIRGVARSLNVTITALNVAATLAVALQTQKTVLKGVQAVDKTTEDLLAQTANSLKTQGTEIHKKAASANLNVNVLKSAFADVTIALEDIGNFRQQALPAMSKSIEEMAHLTRQMDRSIANLETSDKNAKEILLPTTAA